MAGGGEEVTIDYFLWWRSATPGRDCWQNSRSLAAFVVTSPVC